METIRQTLSTSRLHVSSLVQQAKQPHVRSVLYAEVEQRLDMKIVSGLAVLRWFWDRGCVVASAAHMRQEAMESGATKTSLSRKLCGQQQQEWTGVHV